MAIYQGTAFIGGAGKSPYEYALAAGFKGTEAEFYAAYTKLYEHIDDKNNPHGITAEQLGVPTIEQMNEAIASSTPDVDVSGDINLHNTSSEAHSDIRQTLANKANASDIPTTLAELTDDVNHRVVTDAEKSAWNAKSNFSGSYNDLTNKPTIPSIAGLATEEYVANAIATIPTPDVSGQINAHNVDGAAHNDIRELINAKSNFSGNYDDLTNKPTLFALRMVTWEEGDV